MSTPPIAFAVLGNDLALVKERLAKGCDVNEITNRGTALYVACLYNRVQIARFLLENGADPRVKDRSGRTPIDVAREDEMITLLQEFGADPPKTSGPLRQRAHTLHPSRHAQSITWFVDDGIPKHNHWECTAILLAPERSLGFLCEPWESYATANWKDAVHCQIALAEAYQDGTPLPFTEHLQSRLSSRASESMLRDITCGIENRTLIKLPRDSQTLEFPFFLSPIRSEHFSRRAVVALGSPHRLSELPGFIASCSLIEELDRIAEFNSATESELIRKMIPHTPLVETHAHQTEVSTAEELTIGVGDKLPVIISMATGDNFAVLEVIGNDLSGPLTTVVHADCRIVADLPARLRSVSTWKEDGIPRSESLELGAIVEWI